MSGSVRVYSKYHEQRINDLTATVENNKNDIETQLNTYKVSNDARVQSAEDAHSAYVSSNNARVSSLESDVANNLTTFNNYKAANDVRVKAAEDKAAADKIELQTNIDNVNAQLSADKLELEGVISANKADAEAKIKEVKDEILTDTGLSSRIDTLFTQKLDESYFNTIKQQLEDADSSLSDNLTAKFTEAVSKHNAQAVVINELIRYIKALSAGMEVYDAEDNLLSLDETKLTDTTSA